MRGSCCFLEGGHQQPELLLGNPLEPLRSKHKEGASQAAEAGGCSGRERVMTGGDGGAASRHPDATAC